METWVGAIRLWASKFDWGNYQGEKKPRMKNLLGMLMIEQVTNFHGIFSESFELKDFPLDCQELTLFIKFTDNEHISKVVPNPTKK